MLREGQEGTGRIWLLLRYLDRQGRGWLRIDLIQKILTDKDSELRVCGRRQLRNLLRQGRGIFWELERASTTVDRLWLRSPAKVAMALGVERLVSRAVALPVEALLGGIGQVRAHLYASFHSGRSAGEAVLDRARACSSPISRARLQAITHVPERTQRVYDKKAGVTQQSNIAMGELYTPEKAKECAWRHGRCAFQFVDHHGKLGRAGTRYLAWRLPNSYVGPHDLYPMGRQKKINRQIGLVNSGAQGNDLPGHKHRMPRHQSAYGRLFYLNGREAGKAYNRDGTADVYWPERGSSAHWNRSHPRSCLWHGILGQEKTVSQRANRRAASGPLAVIGNYSA